MAHSSLLRIPKPKTFLYLMSLRTGTELITLTTLINKLTGLYGLLALLTGYHLSTLQLSMYLYSLAALVLTALLAPHIRRGPQSPFQILALAWLYLIDSAVNATYTAAFGFGWFLVLAQHTAPASDSPAVDVPGKGMMDDTAGLTSPQYSDVARVEVVASPAPGMNPAQDAALIAHGPDSLSSATSSSAAGIITRRLATATLFTRRDEDSSAVAAGVLGSTILQPGSIASIVAILALWAVRVYFILVVLAYARACLRQHVVSRAANGVDALGPADSGDRDAMAGAQEGGGKGSVMCAENPFRRGTPAGAGWRGAVGRTMVRVGRGFWLGVEESELDGSGRRSGEGYRNGRSLQMEWERRFNNGGDGSKGGHGKGAGERERRRRAGTDPPAPALRPIELDRLRK